jgi:hypothetical protein
MTTPKKFGRRECKSQAAELMIFGSAVIARNAGFFKPAAAINSNKNGGGYAPRFPVK